jgi:hypothetical protein
MVRSKKLLLSTLLILLISISFSWQVFATAGQWSSKGSLIYYSAGNIGIGANSTDRGSYKLQIGGGTSGTGKSNLIRLSHGNSSSAATDRYWTIRTLQYGRADYASYALEINQPASAYSGCSGCGGDLVLRPWRNVVVRSSNTAADGKLLVYGQIQAKEVLVTADANYWPDYVFGEDYKLRSIPELEMYINENKHLPGIQSSKEIGKSGLSLGDMQQKQMEKIEELTLYIIQQQKEIDALKTQVKQLTK